MPPPREQLAKQQQDASPKWAGAIISRLTASGEEIDTANLFNRTSSACRKSYHTQRWQGCIQKQQHRELLWTNENAIFQRVRLKKRHHLVGGRSYTPATKGHTQSAETQTQTIPIAGCEYGVQPGQSHEAGKRLSLDTKVGSAIYDEERASSAREHVRVVPEGEGGQQVAASERGGERHAL
eukprot:2947493-Pleurochrysis_carterae.AAC.1